MPDFDCKDRDFFEINNVQKEKNSECGIRCSLENFAHYGNIEVYPLYAISNLV